MSGRSRLHLCQVLNWQQDEAVAYFSRLREEFGAGKWITYLLKDSLACTTAAKHKLHSRAAAYKRVGHSLGGYPMASEQRPFRFRTDQPVLGWACSRPGGCPVGDCDAREAFQVDLTAAGAAADGEGGVLLSSRGQDADADAAEEPASPLDDLRWLEPPVAPPPRDTL